MIKLIQIKGRFFFILEFQHENDKEMENFTVLSFKVILWNNVNTRIVAKNYKN